MSTVSEPKDEAKVDDPEQSERFRKLVEELEAKGELGEESSFLRLVDRVLPRRRKLDN